ncbi:hypothetical protein IQ07DRAFT_50796 [Pyrenochaeta sp. DS3sAY3a]|nr:hypothetical protein IQ07DRAFT_50796 [Pyrenochaeta sp. DS3sAY3a]
MRFFTLTTLFVAAVAAQYGAEETCGPVTTITITETIKHTPSAPAAHSPSSAPYPTHSVVSPVPSGTGYPSYPAVPEASSVGTGYYPPKPVYPTGTSAKPTGTGAVTSAYPEFTGAAAHVKVGGVLAGAGAVAALFL